MSGDGAFTWRDANRTVLFREGALKGAAATLAESGVGEFDLLTTPRAVAEAEVLADGAAAVHEVASGGVPELSAAILGKTTSPALVALGGGRVIDTAKAVASVEGQKVAAIPTTLSGAEMTGIHRFPDGADDRIRGLVRPELVIADPEAMTGQPEAELRASAMNALAHGADSLYTPFANPVSRMTALRGAELIGEALDQGPAERDREALALGSILCGYAIDSALFAIHHVICQTLVRELGIPHAWTNAAILPQAMAFMRERAPEQIEALAGALGTQPASLPKRIAELGRPKRLSELGANEDGIDSALDAIEARPQLAFTPDAPDREQLRTIIGAAW